MPPRAILLAAVVGMFASTSACYVEAGVPAPAYADGYQPQFYEDHVVYYDDGGRPFYYADGAVVWVPLASPFYVGLVNHWRVYRPAYARWYGHYGYRYRGYRGGGYRGGGYRGGGGHRR